MNFLFRNMGSVPEIITGDDDLLMLNPFQNIKIMKPNDFEKMLKKHDK